jgi:hypothetical protein
MNSIFRTIVVSMVLAVVTGAAGPAAGQWIENGTPVCAAVGNQRYHDLCRTDFGLIVIVWDDGRGANSDIYAQCMDPSGNVLWAPDGVPVCTQTGNQMSPAVVTDGAGGVIILWADDRAGDFDIYAQRIEADGNALWASGGVLVCTAANDQIPVKAIPDGSGGAILTWQDQRYGMTDTDIFAERIDASGAGQWAANGVMVCGVTGNQYSPKIVSDGAGGVVIVWDDSNTSDIYAMRMRDDGVLLWTLGGVAVTAASYEQQGSRMIPDGHGGAIIAWQDLRNASDYDIYVQRMDTDGNALWTVNGVALCTETGTQYIGDIVTDGNGGAIVNWSDYRGADSRVYAQRVNRNGLPQWQSNGSLVCTDNDDQYACSMIPDGAGGALISMTDNRSGDDDVYVQRISGEFGGAYWTSEGIPVCDYPGEQDVCLLVSDGQGGAIAVWWDFRNDADYDIYVQRIDRNGFWGYPCPMIFEAEDVPNDQGGRVMITWEASRIDSYAEEGIQYYSVWRQLGAPDMQALVDAGVKEVASSMIGPEFEGEAFRFVSFEGEMYGFEWLANVDAHEMPTYSYAAATLYDSTAVDPGIHTFMVSAHYYPSVFWDSPLVVAYSVDNLAPCMPLELVGEQSHVPAGLELTWSPNTEFDLGGSNIYREVGTAFEPGPGNLLTTTCDTMTFDGGWMWEAGFCYKVAAVDIHGNESEYAVLNAGQITGDDPMPLPDATFLAQNYPNPFNPITNIGFGIKEQGYVSLRIYDAAGRLVATLIDEARPAGSYAIEWNGRDNGGGAAASGVYFYRLIAGDFVQTRKIVLLK